MINALTRNGARDSAAVGSVLSFFGGISVIKRFILNASLALAAAVAMAGPAMAGSVLFGSDDKFLYNLNTTTGAATLVGATGLTGFDSDGYGSILRDLTSSNKALYGAQWTSTPDGITGAVATIDKSTGALISSTTVTGLVENGFNRGLYALAYDLGTNTLFGSTSRRIYTINASTGAATFIGLTSVGSIIGLGIDNGSGALYAVTQTVDANNNTVTLLNNLSKVNASVLSSVALNNFCGCDIAFDPLTNQGYASSLFYDANGALDYAGLDALNASRTGTSFIGRHGSGAPGNMSGLAFFGVAGGVPEPGTWAMMIAGFGLVGFSMRRSTQKRLKTARA